MQQGEGEREREYSGNSISGGGMQSEAQAGEGAREKKKRERWRKKGGRGHFGWNVASLWSRLLARLDGTAGQSGPWAPGPGSINKGYIDAQRKRWWAVEKAKEKGWKKVESQRTFKTRESAQPGKLKPYSLPFETWLDETLCRLQEDGGRLA